MSSRTRTTIPPLPPPPQLPATATPTPTLIHPTRSPPARAARRQLPPSALSALPTPSPAPAAVVSRPGYSLGSERSDGSDVTDESDATTGASRINTTNTTNGTNGTSESPATRPNTARVLESRRSAGLSGVATVSGPRNHHNSGPPSHHHLPPPRPPYSVDTVSTVGVRSETGTRVCFGFVLAAVVKL